MQMQKHLIIYALCFSEIHFLIPCGFYIGLNWIGKTLPKTLPHPCHAFHTMETRYQLRHASEIKMTRHKLIFYYLYWWNSFSYFLWDFLPDTRMYFHNWVMQSRNHLDAYLLTHMIYHLNINNFTIPKTICISEIHRSFSSEIVLRISWEFVQAPTPTNPNPFYELKAIQLAYGIAQSHVSRTSPLSSHNLY